MFLILCQVNNSLQGRGKLKCVRQILRRFRCLWRRKTKYSRRGSQEGCRDWGLLDYLLFSHLPFYASLPLANSGIIYCWQPTQRVCFEWKQYFRNRKDYEQIKTLTNKTWKPKHKNSKKNSKHKTWKHTLPTLVRQKTELFNLRGLRHWETNSNRLRHVFHHRWRIIQLRLLSASYLVFYTQSGIKKSLTYRQVEQYVLHCVAILVVEYLLDNLKSYACNSFSLHKSLEPPQCFYVYSRNDS